MQDLKWAGIGLALCAVLSPASTGAQQQSPSTVFGVTTGLVLNDNRGLDEPSQGNTTELFSRLDFNFVRADPLQSLTLDGDITLRALSGAEEDSIPDGLTDPRLRLRYNRAVRNAQLTFTAFGRQTETNTLIDEFEGTDITQINESATRLTFGFDASVELGRAAPFGVTLSTGYTGLRYSNTTSTTLQDQDRTRIGADFRFDINPVLEARIRTRYSTFEEDGSTDGQRDTFRLDTELEQDLQRGSFGVSAGITRVEEGERYRLNVSRSIETELWSVGGSLGIEQAISGDTFGSGTLDVAHDLQNGAMSLAVSQGLRSSLDDEEEEFTRLQFRYLRDLSRLSAMSLNASYQEVNPTGTGGTTSLGQIGVTYQHTLAPGWDMNVGLNHRVNTNSVGTTARDNQLSLSIRRALVTR